MRHQVRHPTSIEAHLAVASGWRDPHKIEPESRDTLRCVNMCCVVFAMPFERVSGTSGIEVDKQKCTV